MYLPTDVFYYYYIFISVSASIKFFRSKIISLFSMSINQSSHSSSMLFAINCSKVTGTSSHVIVSNHTVSQFQSLLPSFSSF